ncbi:MAG: hypothetical protein QME12_06620 [Nanoarchaeota archaeon]|nr:hypothetical protein [Nanoarchaeota archaeon]
MATTSGFIEGIILSLVFVAVFNIAIATMNHDYGKDFDAGFSDNSGAEQLFVKYQDTAQTQIQGGEAQFDATQGITVKSSWGLAKDAVTISWRFITGGWIENVAEKLNLGEAGTALAVGLRIIYFIGLLMALLYVLFKVIL